MLVSKPNINIHYNQCTPNSIPFCLIQETPTKCLSCLTGYFLNSNNRCQLNPWGAIANCTIYNNSPTACFQCANRFIRSATTDPNACIAVTPITNCLTYDGNATTSVCTRCDTGFYVSSNTCVARKAITDQNCATLDSAADSCGECVAGY
jgi:hypothetical protein